MGRPLAAAIHNLQVGQLWGRITSNYRSLSPIVPQILTAIAALLVSYLALRAIYNVYYHPLSKYPGPKLAAMTDLWWARAMVSGRYPWIIEAVIKRYGPVVRIAPNELVFLTPQAAKDIYLSQEKSMELFVLVGYDALDTGDGGIANETDPVRHRAIAKKLAPAFSTRNLKAKEAPIYKHIDLFVQRMREHGGEGKGAEMRRWCDWLGLDLSADLTYGVDMGQMRNLKDSMLLTAAMKMNLVVTMSTITRKIPLLTPLTYLCIPPSILFLMPKLIRNNSQDVKDRIARRGKTDHLDYFEHLIPADADDKTGAALPHGTKKELYTIENIAAQLMLAGWQPVAGQFYALLLFLLGEATAYKTLVEEIRGAAAFKRYDDITLEAVGELKYLHACVQESLRLHPETGDGLPRVSPGAVIDGSYVPPGVVCQIAYFAAHRSERYFTDPLMFRPERWLKPDHPRYDARYKDDDLRASRPFSQGPRGCPGGAIASAVVRLFTARVLWEFDLEPGVPGPAGLPVFERDFRYMNTWDRRPELWVKFKPVKEGLTARE
ncbi:cytochrome P450 [Apodospora peruviana]|uniref:Cytochrome P450 n=1 Tax=Apodospora peruviana TaxID=516989 RepID=A0AAE0I5B8_9PEZI|nr:cytochrome P450 [Apodospora peruviana]